MTSDKRYLQSLLFWINYNGNENILKQNAGSLNFQILHATITYLHFPNNFKIAFCISFLV